MSPRKDYEKFKALVSEHGLTKVAFNTYIIDGIQYLSLVAPELLRSIADELLDEKFLTAEHGTRSTYNNKKCNGPLCKHANTVAQRERRAAEEKATQNKIQILPENERETFIENSLRAIALSHRIFFMRTRPDKERMMIEEPDNASLD